VFGVHNASGLLVNHLLAKPMAGAGVDLMEMGLLGL
jgi:hypothetical protein